MDLRLMDRDNAPINHLNLKTGKQYQSSICSRPGNDLIMVITKTNVENLPLRVPETIDRLLDKLKDHEQMIWQQLIDFSASSEKRAYPRELGPRS